MFRRQGLQIPGHAGCPVKKVGNHNMSDDLKIITDLAGALTLLLKGEKGGFVAIPETYPENELKSLAGNVNEIIRDFEALSDSAFALSKGDFSYEIPRGRMRIHDALKNLHSSLTHLTWKTKKIAGGDFDQKIDFMGEFSNAFNSMTMQLKEAFEIIEKQKNDLIRNEREMRRDLKLAAIIQKNLISDKIHINGVSIKTIYTPMILIGGDIYSFVEFRNEQQFGVFIADVNGHGVNAALVTGMIKVLIHSAGEMRRNPSELLYYINRSFVGFNLDIYFTALYGICDVKNRIFTYARGGHNLPYLIHKNGTIKELSSDGPMLGVVEEVVIENKTVELETGDKLMLYTDGLSETENDEGVSFESGALQEILRINSKMNIEKLINTVYSELIEYNGSEKFGDDVCILGIEIL